MSIRPRSCVIDVGGGASTLVDDLLGRGLNQITELDLSTAALGIARARIGAPSAHRPVDRWGRHLSRAACRWVQPLARPCGAALSYRTRTGRGLHPTSHASGYGRRLRRYRWLRAGRSSPMQRTGGRSPLRTGCLPSIRASFQVTGLPAGASLHPWRRRAGFRIRAPGADELSPRPRRPAATVSAPNHHRHVEAEFGRYRARGSRST